MRGKVAKKIHKMMKRGWEDYYKEMEEFPLGMRVRIGWHIVTHHRKGGKLYEGRDIRREERP